MVDEAAMERLVKWCRQQKADAEQSLELMRAGALKVFHGPAHDQAHDVTDQQIADAERVVRDMDAIINAEERRKASA